MWALVWPWAVSAILALVLFLVYLKPPKRPDRFLAGILLCLTLTMLVQTVRVAITLSEIPERNQEWCDERGGTLTDDDGRAVCNITRTGADA